MALTGLPSAVSLCTCLYLAGLLSATLAAPLSRPQEAPHSLLDRFVSAATALQLFSGVVRVTSRDSVFSKAYGSEVLESGAPLQAEAILPIASNTKLFTAVAVHQLIEQGLIQWEDPVSKYVSMLNLLLLPSPKHFVDRPRHHLHRTSV